MHTSQKAQKNSSVRTLQERVLQLEEKNRFLLNELKKRELSYTALQNSHKYLTGAIEQIPVGILVREIATGKIIKTNSEFERLVGLRNLEGQDFFSLYGKEKGWACYHADDSLCQLEDLPSYRSSIEGDVYKNVEFLLERHDGAKIWIMVNTAPVQDEKGNVIGVSILIQDINEDKEAEEKLRINEERLHYALTASDEGLWDFNYATGDGYLSPRYFEMLGYENMAFPGSDKQWAEMLHPQDREEAVRKFREVGESKTDTYRSIYRLRTKTGDYRWILSRGIVANRDPSNKILRIVGTHLDITEQKKMEEALKRANEKLETKVRDRTEALHKSISVSKRVREELTELNLLDAKSREFVAKSPEMKQLLKTAVKLSNLHVSNILITGDSGTGKSRLAKFIHNISKGSKKPFVQINCAALPENLLEAELFGYEKGAFTGAREEGKAGLFELAQDGTLFLDEIGEMSLAIQAKLLKYLDDKEIMHLGGLKPIQINCMVIAATNAPLKELIQQKKFRQDLFFRLNTFPIRIPSLTDRPEDLFALIDFFIHTYNKQYGLNRRLSSKGYKALQEHVFPGNVRELRNFINKIVVLSEDNSLDEIITQELSNANRPNQIEQLALDSSEEGFEKQVADFEISLLTAAMKKNKSTRKLASHLKMSQSAVVRRLKKHGLSRDLAS